MISGVILAAGTSSRLGRPKQLLELGGRPALQHAIDRAASAGVDELILVLGHEAARIRSAVHLPPFGRTVANPDYATGQGSSLRAGLAAIDPRSEAVVILLGDQPGLDPHAVMSVLSAWREGPSAVARAVYRGTPGHPVVIGRAAFAEFEEATGDDGGRSILSTLAVAEVDIDSEPPADLDTWDQYEAVRGEF